jgi:transposase InsO family protein
LMDLHSRKIVGWAMNKRMTTILILRALQPAIHCVSRYEA